MKGTESSTQAQVPPLLAALVAKNGVHLGGLSVAERALALVWVWAGLPRTSGGAVLTEAAVNEALKSQLHGAAQFLATDHVELRRWLVDAGFLQRDGYGRAYQRVSLEQLPAAVQPEAHLLDRLDTSAWARDSQERLATERAKRRAAWESTQQGKQGAGP